MTDKLYKKISKPTCKAESSEVLPQPEISEKKIRHQKL